MFDSHVHTTFSTDSSMELEDALKQAREQKLGLITTEHMDLKYPSEGKFIFDVEEYFDAYSNYRGDELLIGIEIGLRSDCIEENNRISAQYAFDFVLGSVHLVDGVDIYLEEYYQGISKKEAYERYFNYMASCVKENTFFDSLSHIDYIARYARCEDKEIHYEEFKEQIDEVLNTVIQSGRVLELNTRRLDNQQNVNNLIKIYKRYHDLGGAFVTIGSDSHAVCDIGRSFHTATELCSHCGIRPVYFKERKMIVFS